MKVVAEYSPTVSDLAYHFWELDYDEQAEFMAELYEKAGEYKLMLQFLYVRQECEKRKDADPSDTALDCFQTMFAAAFKYFGDTAA